MGSAVRENVVWWEIINVSKSLCRKVKKYDVGLIIGISRGGLTPASCLSYTLGCQNVISWNLNNKDRNFNRFLQSEIEGFILKGKKVLIVDDIFDSGNTLNNIVDYLKHKLPAYCVRDDEPNIIISALYRRARSKLSIPESMTAVKMVYSERVWHSRWLVFPWERI